MSHIMYTYCACLALPADGYKDELGAKYPDPRASSALWAASVGLFSALPLAAKTADTFIVHGGLPSEGFAISDLEAIPPEVRARLGSVLTPVAGAEAAHDAEEEEEAAGGASGAAGEAGEAGEAMEAGEAGEAMEAGDTAASQLARGVLWSDPAAGREHSGAVSNASRGGAGAIFGEDVTRSFLRAHGLVRVVRSH